MKISRKPLIALTTLGVMGVTSFSGLGGGTAQAASSDTWKAGAILGGAAAVYGVVKHNNTVAIAGGLGALYSYNQYKKEKKKEDQQKYYGYNYSGSNNGSYNAGYDNGYHDGYNDGARNNNYGYTTGNDYRDYNHDNRYGYNNDNCRDDGRHRYESHNRYGRR